MGQRLKYKSILAKYLPEEYCDLVIDLLIKHPVRFKVSKPRKTKLGDFRANRTGLHQITINGDLNQYAFLITTLHEFAHLITYEQHSNRVQPHGIEWKNNFRSLLDEVLNKKALPKTLDVALGNYFLRMKASSCTDINLQRVLMTFDESSGDEEILENLKTNDKFVLNNRVFVKGNLRRTRYLCTDTNNNRVYLVNALAKVNKLNE